MARTIEDRRHLLQALGRRCDAARPSHAHCEYRGAEELLVRSFEPRWNPRKKTPW